MYIRHISKEENEYNDNLEELKRQLEAKEVQQKEFIEWLENEIKRMDKLMNAGKPKPYGEE